MLVVLKALGHSPSMLLTFSSICWYQVLDKVVPTARCTGLVPPIIKAGNLVDKSNYRGITVVVLLGKLYAVLLEAKISAWAEH